MGVDEGELNSARKRGEILLDLTAEVIAYNKEKADMAKDISVMKHFLDNQEKSEQIIQTENKLKEVQREIKHLKNQSMNIRNKT